MKKLSLMLLWPVGLANAQWISIGVIGGFPFNDVVKTIPLSAAPAASSPASSNFLVGPSVQLNLPANFRFEGDMLYRPYNLTESFFQLGLVGFVDTVNVSASQFSFPLLLQYRFGHHFIKPFVEGGMSMDHLANISSSSTILHITVGMASPPAPGGIPTTGPGSLSHQTHVGPVAGGGLEIKIPLVRLSAEVRYSRQGYYFNSFSNVNVGEVLIGVHF